VNPTPTLGSGLCRDKSLPISKPDDDPASTSTARGARGGPSIDEVVELLSSPVESADGCRETTSARRIFE
jgi:hypothetical protein